MALEISVSIIFVSFPKNYSSGQTKCQKKSTPAKGVLQVYFFLPSFAGIIPSRFIGSSDIF
jgi:hypothetical protein